MNNRLLRRRAELDILRHAWSIHAVHYAFNRFASLPILRRAKNRPTPHPLSKKNRILPKNKKQTRYDTHIHFTR